MASSSPKYRARTVKGMRDLAPPETAVWSYVESVARSIFGSFGFREIRTPVVEETELFVRGVGEGSDIVTKQMYTFPDKKGKSLTLRPETTAGVARAFVQLGMQELVLPVRLFYIGPQFRYERPQRGRYRQFHQIGAELIGDPGPWSDVEVIQLLVTFLETLGFENLRALVNTVGDRESRQVFGEALRDFLEPVASDLSEDSRRRLATNPLRILDSKSPADRALLEGAPGLSEYLSPASRSHFEAVLGGLSSCGIDVVVEERLVRGLDYYTSTVFEIVAEDGLGAQNALVGGGRYDGLVAEMGGTDQPAIGFAIGLDRLIEILPATSVARAGLRPAVEVVAVGEVSPLEALIAAQEIRSAGVAASAEVSGRSVKAALRRADKRGAETVVLLGEDELAADAATIRDFREGTQVRVARNELATELKRRAAEERQ